MIVKKKIPGFLATGWVPRLEKGIRIDYPYNFGLPLGNLAFVMIWIEFDLLVRTIVQI